MNEQNDRVALILAVIASIGFPTVFGFAWTQTGNIWQALGLMVVYGGIILIVGMVTGVWKRLQPDFEEGAANAGRDWLKRRAHRKYRQPYLDYLYYSHRIFDVKGLTTHGPFSLELEQVFVDLNIRPETPMISTAAQGKGALARSRR